MKGAVWFVLYHQ